VSGTPIRGQVYRADIGFGLKPWLVVSNDLRNRALPNVLAVRLTTSPKRADLPTWVPLAPDDPLAGHAVVDDLQQLDRDELADLLGALSPGTILAVNDALRIALALP
jgi:mRNA interferase MazF